jgi:hypothetical protein
MRLGFSEQFNPPAGIVINLKKLANEIAEPIRDKFGAFSPTCAYRCPRANTAVKGSATSFHLKGQAFDETFFNSEGTNISAQVFYWLVENRDTIPFTELIWEKGTVDVPQWLHIGNGDKKQSILAFDGKFYTPYFQSNHYKYHKTKGYVK